MNLQLPFTTTVFYFILAILSSWFGIRSDTTVSTQSHFILQMTCPGTPEAGQNTTRYQCPSEERPAFISLLEFIAAGGSVSSDDCGIDTLSFQLISESTSNPQVCFKTTTRVYQIRDSCGRTVQCSHRTIINDYTTPIITCPPIPISCDQPVPTRYMSFSEFLHGLSHDGGEVSDNCSLDTSTWQYLGDSLVYNLNCYRTIIRRYSIEDSCNNLALCNQKFIIEDNTLPNFIPAHDTTLYIDASCIADTSIITLGGITNITDNCGILGSNFRDVVRRQCTAYDTILRVWMVWDSCMNIKIDTQFIYVLDTLKPTITGPPDQIFLCSSQIPPPDTTLIIATDNCSNFPVKKYVRDSVADSLCLNNKVLFRIYTATDFCNNTLRFQQRLTVRDTVGPVLTCPNDTIVTCVSLVPSVNTSLITGIDFCGSTVRVIHLKDSLSVPDSVCLNRKIIYRIYVGRDTCLNTTRCVQRITIRDTIAPSITCPRDTVVACSSQVPAINPSSVSGTDNCGGPVRITHVKDSSSIADSICLNKKIIYRIYQGRDTCLNTSRCIQKITVSDTIPPTILCPADTLIQCIDEVPLVNLNRVTASDNCAGNVRISFIKDSVPAADSSCPGNKIIYRIFNAQDTCFNSARCIQMIEVVDTIAPAITCPPDQNVDCILSVYTSLDSFLFHGGTIFDACGLDSSSFVFAGEVYEQVEDQIIATRKYKISDLCGNTDSCVYSLTSPICFVDLALRKTINDIQDPYFADPGAIVPVCVTIFNQGFVIADNIKLIEYFPAPGTTILSKGWIDNGDGTAVIYLSKANGLLSAGGLLPGDSVAICFDIKLPDHIKKTELINICEINEARDTFRNILPDIDSHADNIRDNDYGGVPNSSDDNNINGDSRLLEDEDDSDPALFYVCPPLTCLNKANVSADADSCMHCIKASELLTGNLLPDEFYTVTIFDSYGKKLPSNCIGREYLGQTLIYSIAVLSCSQNYCWGHITFEDKSPPQFDCTPDTVYCFELGNLPAIPIAYDNCSGPAKITVVKEVWQDLGCQGGEIQGIFTRTLNAKDIWNNSRNCDKIYYLRSINLADVICARDTTFECTDSTSILNPNNSGAPTINGYKLWPQNATCKLFITYKDQRVELCGPGYKIFRTWIVGDHCTSQEFKCIQLIKVEDRTAPIIDTLQRNIKLFADPHDCYGVLDLKKAVVRDCSPVIQSYIFHYQDPNEPIRSKTLTGALPARIRIPIGENFKIYIQATDECNYSTRDSIYVSVYDITPPNPVCHEFTQLTLDPDSCWTRIIAKDLDNGSTDNCCSTLHFAVAFMTDIEAARKNFINNLQLECGSKEYWSHKEWYDEYIEDWISCYVFKDSLDVNGCGTQQVVLRVYEACDLPVYDPHVFPCSPHAWHCYNTSWRYRVFFNQTFIRPGGSKSCGATAPWACKSKLISSFNEWSAYNIPYYQTQDISKNCDSLFGANNPQVYCPKSLYNDCMVQLLVDDKQKPYCDSLKNIEVYCDGIIGPGYAYSWSVCGQAGDEYTSWPGNIRINNDNTIYGYYGGSVKQSHDEHQTVVPACEYNEKDDLQPIYCRAWLELDRYDNPGKLSPQQLFSIPVITDKNHPRRPLQANEFRVGDNCAIDSVTFKDNGSIDQCGVGWIERIWTIKDKCGNVSNCSQKIYIQHRSDFEVIFPEDKEIECSYSNATHPDQSGRPIISDDECELVAVQFQDDTFKQAEDACFKILRTWTLVDECSYNAHNGTAHFKNPDIIVDDRLRANLTDRLCVFRNLKDNGDGFMKYIQVIKVYDHSDPVIRCVDTTICYNGPGCDVPVNIPINGTDNCAANLWYDLAFDKDQDGQFDDEFRNHVTSITGPFKPGIYRIRIIANDHCGNADTCISVLNIKDCKAPTPYCLNGVATVIMPSSGNIEIWASDLNRGSFDNCTSGEKLIFTFDEAGSFKSRTYSCKDIPNGQAATLPVDIWVHDEGGNKDFCRTYILLQDNSGTSNQPGGICKDTAILLNEFVLKGRIMTEDKESIDQVQVELKSEGLAFPMQITGAEGAYVYPGLPRNNKVLIAPHRNDNPVNGVSTLDLLLIEKHIKGTLALNSSYKMIAADVDHNGEINVIDLVELRKLILGIYDVLPKSESWRFIPATHAFADPAHPFDYPMSAVVDEMHQDLQMDFTGVKIGDVNSTVQPHSLLGLEIREENAGLIFNLNDQKVRKGQVVNIEVTSPNFSGIAGFQGTLHFEGLQLTQVEPKKIDFKSEHIGMRWASENDITFSWEEAHSIDIPEGQGLFTLQFIALRDLRLSETMWISSKHTRAESYEGNGELKNLSLKFSDAHGRSVFPEHQLIQNYPNPFSRSTVIGIQLQQGGKGSLRFFDLNGKQIKSIDKVWNAGYQEIQIDDRDFPTAGIYFYKFESSFFNASRKMILKL